MTSFPVDGPHSPDTIRQAADTAAEAIRYLNYGAQIGSPALKYAGDAYPVLGALYQGTGGLQQLLNQLAAYLRAEALAGRHADDHGRDPALQALAAATALEGAAQMVPGLTAALQQAQNDIAGLYLKAPTGG